MLCDSYVDNDAIYDSWSGRNRKRINSKLYSNKAPINYNYFFIEYEIFHKIRVFQMDP